MMQYISTWGSISVVRLDKSSLYMQVIANQRKEPFTCLRIFYSCLSEYNSYILNRINSILRNLDCLCAGLKYFKAADRTEDLAREAVYFKITTVTCYSRKLSQRGNNKYLFLKINGYR